MRALIYKLLSLLSKKPQPTPVPPPKERVPEPVVVPSPPPEVVVDTTPKEPLWYAQLRADIGRHEGFRPFAYPDPLSVIGRAHGRKFGYRPARQVLKELGLDEKQGAPWTIGHGFTKGVTIDSFITLDESFERLDVEIKEHLKVLDRLIPTWTGMPLYVKTVLGNIAFNLGYNRLAQFAPTLEEFKKGNYKEAARRLRNTLWYKQVGARSQELVLRLETGKIEDKHKVTQE